MKCHLACLNRVIALQGLQLRVVYVIQVTFIQTSLCLCLCCIFCTAVQTFFFKSISRFVLQTWRYILFDLKEMPLCVHCNSTCIFGCVMQLLISQSLGTNYRNTSNLRSRNGWPIFWDATSPVCNQLQIYLFSQAVLNKSQYKVKQATR
jgi:hypothetical protein